MKIVKPNWYGLDHTAVQAHFDGDLRFCNDFCVKDEYKPCAVYRANKVNRSKKHRKYVLISGSTSAMIVRGMTIKEMQKYRYQAALHCLKCDSVVHSANRHHMAYCPCGAVAIDGGKDYTKVSMLEVGARYNIVTLDLLTDKVKK
jgi:hypothetical protein